MRPTTRTSSRTRSTEKPPTSWRSPSAPNLNTDHNSAYRRRRSSAGKDGRREGDRSSSKPTFGSPLLLRTGSHESELIIRRHVTRDSMLDNILLSFNQMHDGQGPHPKQPPLYSSFKDGEFKLDTPCFVYDARSQVSTRSRSSSTSSNQDLKHPTTTFIPYQIHATPIRRSSLAQTHSTGALRSQTKSPNRTSSPTPRPRLRRGAEAMSFETPQMRRASKKSRASAASMDLGTTNVDRTKWSKRRSGSFSTHNGGLTTDSTRSKAGKSFLESPTMDTTGFASPVLSNMDETTSDFPPTLHSSSLPIPVQPIDNFRPQNSSRNKVASVAGSSVMLANSARPAVSDTKNRPYMGTDTREPQFGGPITSPKRARSQPLSEAARAERPGFFKRVFGSTRSIPTVEETQSELALLTSNESNPFIPPEDMSGKDSRTRSTPHTKLSSTPSTPTGPPTIPSGVADILKNLPPPAEHSLVLHKKASFFRRRKRAPELDRNYESDMRNAPGSLSRKVTAQDRSQLNDSTSSLPKEFTPAIATPSGMDDAKFVFKFDQPAFSPSVLSTPTGSRISILNESNAIGTGTPQGIATASNSKRQSRQSVGMQIPPETHSSIMCRSPRDSSDTDVFQDASPVSMLSAQMQTIRLVDIDSPPATPIPSPMSRPEYPASLQALRTTGLALSTNIPMTIYPHYDGNHIIPAPPSTSRPVSQADDSMAKPSRRIWIQPEDSDEERRSPRRSSTMLAQPITAAQASFVVDQSGPVITSMSPGARSTTFADVPSPRSSTFSPSSSVVDPQTPTQADVELATKLFFRHGAQDDQAAEQLGRPGHFGERLRQAYMDLLDLKGYSVLNGLRQLCTSLTLKGESQQIDRILISYSQRWCECNQRSGVKLEAIITNITYALLLLNTDLHVADMGEKMSRAQFVKNTLSAIRQIVYEDVFESESMPASGSAGQHMSSGWLDVRGEHAAHESLSSRPSMDTRNSNRRGSMRPPARPASAVSSFSVIPGTPTTGSRGEEPVDALLTASFDQFSKTWEPQVEAVLKIYYNSIKQQSLPLSGDTTDMLSVRPGMPHRSNSSASKIPIESLRGRVPEERTMRSRWNARNRSKGKVPAASIASERPSYDNVLVSPSSSSVLSKTMNRTQTSISSDSYSDLARLGATPMGFASVLNQAMVRGKERIPTANDGSNSVSNTMSLEDEVLMLAGAPWVKEGIVHHKHHLEAAGKKAKDRGWVQCFAVVEKGNMRLFSFTSKASTRAQKNKSSKSVVVGGGNWTESAESLGSFSLRQTLAAILPPPGHKGRPHVFVLRLPSGAAHFYQVGTPEIAEEFIGTINYWSARLSKEPLIGGVDNIEYGWSEAAIDNATLLDACPPSTSRPSASTSQTLEVPSRASFQGSVRSSFESQRGAPKSRTGGDRIPFAEWTPPSQNLSASTLPEGEQLAALEKYLKSVREELVMHNELRPNLAAAYTNRNSNRTKVMANWEKRSAYLLAQITKFSTYVESLSAARLQQERLRREKEEESVHDI